MALPLPRTVADVGPGGGLVTAMGGMNALANANILRQINEIKKTYLPTTLSSEAASKLAYANLMGPQFLAKLLQNRGAVANMGDPVAKAALQKAVGSGMGVGSGKNYLNNIHQHTGIGEPSTNNFAHKIKNAFMELLGQGQQSQQGNNSLVQSPSQQLPMGMPQNNSAINSTPNKRPKDGVTIEGEQWYNTKGEPVYAEEEHTNEPNNAMELELIGGKKRKREPTWEENEGKFIGTLKQGEKSGEYRAKALNDIGEAQVALSNSGAALNSMTKIIKNPIWQEMRDTIPAFQDKQLGILKVTGTDAQKDLIGQYESAAQSLIASTVQGMGSRHLVREYNLAERQKINDSDSVQAAQGKLKNVIELHDIAEQKNNIIADALRSGIDEAEAVKLANKMVNVGAIEKRTNELLADKITNEDIDHTAKETGMTRQQVIKRLKKEGRYHG